MKTWHKVTIGVGGAALLGGIVWFSVNQANKGVVTVQTVKLATLESLVSQVTASGEIKPTTYTNVTAQGFGRITEILVKEGQAVKKGELMFKILPTLYEAKYKAELAEAQLAELELKNTERLAKQNVVSQNEVALYQAKLDKANAKAKLAEAEFKFTMVKAPFDGIIDRLKEQGYEFATLPTE